MSYMSSYIFAVVYFEEKPGTFFMRRQSAEQSMKEGDRLYRLRSGQDWSDKVYLGIKTEEKVSL